MGSDPPYMAAVVTKHVILDERDACGMRPLMVVNSSVTIRLASPGAGGARRYQHSR
ncbi:hypothetical protein PCAR4_390085 [Paraburkholderia caribensis]|nr:hypothetical protein PCAR4_390085 [Paraburkholderia caribensis]